MLAKEVSVPPPSMASHHLASSAASQPDYGESSGNRSILTASPTLSGSLV